MNGKFSRAAYSLAVEAFKPALCLALAVYIWARLVLYEVPFSLLEDGWNLLRAFVLAWMLIILLMALLRPVYYLKLARKHIYHIMPQNSFKSWPTIAGMAISLTVILIACRETQVRGEMRQAETGLQTRFEGLRPGKAFLVMNDEQLAHTDIPIGENFQLINDPVEGLEERNGMVSVGCSLKITDQRGKLILNEPDLFKGKDLLKKEEARMLRCTISTGEPMEWEELYTAEVRFWDKFGKGSITNTVTVRMIDIP
jgi:hypothetical protein